MRVTSVDFELCQVLQRRRHRHVARSSFLPIGNRDFLVSLLRRLTAPRRRKDIQTYNTIITYFFVFFGFELPVNSPAGWLHVQEVICARTPLYYRAHNNIIY
jgi:hypothetical protein